MHYVHKSELVHFWWNLNSYVVLNFYGRRTERWSNVRKYYNQRAIFLFTKGQRCEFLTLLSSTDLEDTVTGHNKCFKLGLTIIGTLLTVGPCDVLQWGRVNRQGRFTTVWSCDKLREVHLPPELQRGRQVVSHSCLHHWIWNTIKKKIYKIGQLTRRVTNTANCS